MALRYSFIAALTSALSAELAVRFYETHNTNFLRFSITVGIGSIACYILSVAEAYSKERKSEEISDEHQYEATKEYTSIEPETIKTIEGNIR